MHSSHTFREFLKILGLKTLVVFLATLAIGLVHELAFRQRLKDLAVETVAMERRIMQMELATHVTNAGFLAELALMHLEEADWELPLGGELEQEMTLFMRGRDSYDQVRFLTPSGREAIRTDLRQGGPAPVPRERLQDKSGRYYFRAGLGLAPGQVYVSPLDLNVENGRVERPFKPMIRFVAPVVAPGDRRLGLVVLNYLSRSMLDRLSGPASSRGMRFYLIDERGYWLIGPDPDLEWGFMFPGQARDRSFDRYPEAWDHMTAAPEGQFIDADGLFTFATLEPSQLGPAGVIPADLHKGRHWKLVGFTPRSNLNSPWRPFLAGLALVLLGFSSITSWLWAQARVRKTRAEEQLWLMSAAVDQSASMVLVHDAKGRLQYVNNAFADFTGYGVEDFVRLQGDELFFCESAGEVCGSIRPTVLMGEEWRGEVSHSTRSGDHFWAMLTVSPVQDAHGRITHMITVMEDITDKKLLERTLERQAYFDSLTGLPNRDMMAQRLQREIHAADRHDHVSALMMLDLDRFKEVNDTHGHDAGDQLLKLAAARLTGCVRATDTVSRQGGDEFTILVTRISDPSDAEVVARKILSELNRPFDLEQGEVRVGASLGLAFLVKGGPHDPGTLARNADQALYQAKEAGRNCYFIFSGNSCKLAPDAAN
jgi:diguanylate cyclase (GGDEF)-like protein/PAS domain S-box-containing protein